MKIATLTTLFIYFSPFIMGGVIFTTIGAVFDKQTEGLKIFECEITGLSFVSIALLSLISFFLSGLFLLRRIKKYGWAKNVLATLMVLPHTLFPLLVLQEFVRLPFWLRLLGEHVLWGGVILWVMCFLIYACWLEYQYQKTSQSN
jgi:hypothetical protein